MVNDERKEKKVRRFLTVIGEDLDRQGFVQRNRADRTWLLGGEIPEHLQNVRGSASRG